MSDAQSLSFRSPVELPLHPKGFVQPRGNHDFRVTLRFADKDAINATRTHGAVDIGNRRCNDPIVAMAPGIAHRVHDQAAKAGASENALGIKIDHGHGVTSEYWHLNVQSAAEGATVAAGDRIGLLGSTGFGVCHCHVVIKLNGKRIDPEPHMFGAPLSLGGSDMALRFTAAQYRPLVNREFQTGRGARFRAGPSTDSAILKQFAAAQTVQPSGVVKGQDLPDRTPAPGFASDEWLEARMLTAKGFELGYFHASTIGGEHRAEV